MSESKFTPGPWRCEIDDDTQEPRIYAPQRENKLREQLICAVGHCREELETSEPTARLIAAAPELYEALKAAVEIIDKWIEPEAMGIVRSGDGVLGHCLRDEYLVNFRAALLKATPERHP